MRGLWQRFGPQFVRFFVVGVAATLVHWGVYVGLNRLLGLCAADALALSVTYSVGYVVSFVGNYLASLRWTFRTKGSVGKGAGFALSHAVNYGMHVGLLNLFLLWGVGEAMVRALEALVPWLVRAFPLLGEADTLLPLPVFCVVVPINFLMVRFFLTQGDKKDVEPS